jgi:catechol 2,3-dioxygenase-like lactoylglutathione lyase family enzyme
MADSGAGRRRIARTTTRDAALPADDAPATPNQVAGSAHLRIARPVSDLAKTTTMYCRGLGLRIIGSFENHDGFDGVMLAFSSSNYHFEFTHGRSDAVAPSPTAEDLIVLYIPEAAEWSAACVSMLDAGFKRVRSFNPYWEIRGRTYVDADGYRIVLQNAEPG